MSDFIGLSLNVRDIAMDRVSNSSDCLPILRTETVLFLYRPQATTRFKQECAVLKIMRFDFMRSCGLSGLCGSVLNFIWFLRFGFMRSCGLSLLSGSVLNFIWFLRFAVLNFCGFCGLRF